MITFSVRNLILDNPRKTVADIQGGHMIEVEYETDSRKLPCLAAVLNDGSIMILPAYYKGEEWRLEYVPLSRAETWTVYQDLGPFEFTDTE